jgi:hypothetical protein
MMTTPDEIAHEIALDNEAIARCNQCVERLEELKVHVDDLENVKKAERRDMERKARKAARVRMESLVMQWKDKERAEERSAMQREMLKQQAERVESESESEKEDEPKKEESTRSGLRKGFL